MKILHISPAIFGAGKRGGGERYVSQLFAAQVRAGSECRVFVVPSFFSFMDATSGVATKASIVSLSRAVEWADVVHVHQLNTPGFDWGVVVAKFYRKPIVLTDHGGGLLSPGRLFGRLRLNFVSAAAYVSAWSRTDIDPGNIVSRFSIIYGGGDHVSGGIAGRSDSTEQHSRKYDFGFVGRLLPHKGAHVAISSLPDSASLVVIGEARDPEYLEVLKGLAKSKDVVFLHDVSDDQLTRCYSSFRYLLVPSVERYQNRLYSRPELLGLVALESLVLGTPVIASNVGGLGEVMQAAGQRVVVAGDVEAWRRELREAKEGPLRATDGSRFTWAAVARRCDELYERVVKVREVHERSS